MQYKYKIMSYLPTKLNPLGLDLKEPHWKSLIQKLDMASYHCSMPVLENVQVTLTEVLEVRGKPLEESELWGILHQTIEAIQDLFLRGSAHKDGSLQHLVTPETLLLTAMGRVILNSCSLEDIRGTKYWCHEMRDAGPDNSDIELEKMYIFTAGQTLLHAASYGISDAKNQIPQKKLSPLIKTVIQAMYQTDPELRMILCDVVQVCTLHASKYTKGISFSRLVARLHQEVLGSLPENEILNEVERDIARENEKDIESSEKELQDISAETGANFSIYMYGHRLGYHPELSHSKGSQTEKLQLNPKERWKSAVAKITERRKQVERSNSVRDGKLPQEWQNHKARKSILRVYEELTERRKMLELLRLSINIGPSVPVDVDKNELLTKGLKPKTIAELVMLLQRPAKQIANSASQLCNENSHTSLSKSATSRESVWTENSMYMERPYSVNPLSPCAIHYQDPSSNRSSSKKPYYSIDDVATDKSFTSSEINAKRKQFFGPEFILQSLKPHVAMSLSSDQDTDTEEKERIKSHCITVVLLNGQQIDIHCMPTATGRQIFHAVAHHLSLPEHYMFGLAYFRDGEYLFIDGRQKLNKITPLNREEDSSENALSESSQNFTLYLRLKFYVDDINLIRNQATRHLYYLQLRKDIIDEFTHCDGNIASVLGGWALQAEFGNYDAEVFGQDYFLVEHYLPYRSIKQLGRESAKEKLIELHLSHSGISFEIAELKYIQETQKLSEYGYHFHKVLQDKKNPLSSVWLAVSSKGVDVYENVAGNRRQCQTYQWSKIKRISFTKRYFCLTPKAESLMGKHVIFKFYTSHSAKGRYLFNMVMSHHQFFVKLKSRVKVSEIFMEDLDIEPSLTGENGEWTSEIIQEKEMGCDIHPQDEHQVSNTNKKSKYFGSLMNLRTSVLGQTLCQKRMPFKEKSRHTQLVPIKPLPLTKYQREVIQGIVDPSKPITRSASAPDCCKDISKRGALGRTMLGKDIHEKVPGTMPRTSCRKKQIKMVRLMKDKNFGFGMTITCGDTYDTVLHGAFVESVLPGSPADCEGNLTPGDQILSVNGINVQNDQFLDVVDLIQHSKSPVELVVAKSNSYNSKNNTHNKLEIISKIENEVSEPLCIKVKTWVNDNKCSDMSLTYHSQNDRQEGGDINENPPVPKPRKKWSEKDKNIFPINKFKHALSDLGNEADVVPDSIITAEMDESTEKKEIDCSIISEHLFRGSNSIPDIIPSEIKRTEKCIESQLVPVKEIVCNSESMKSEGYNMVEPYNIQVWGKSSFPNVQSMDINEMEMLLPGEIYHVVLDKKGGSLGLNIYQGSDSSCSKRRHIYIHSLVPGGAAEIDGRISDGDKLLEVNETLLENLSYHEVVATLRESPQVTHLVLEKGHTANSLEESKHNRIQSVLSYKNSFDLKNETVDRKSAINSCNINGLPAQQSNIRLNTENSCEIDFSHGIKSEIRDLHNNHKDSLKFDDQSESKIELTTSSILPIKSASTESLCVEQTNGSISWKNKSSTFSGLKKNTKITDTNIKFMSSQGIIEKNMRNSVSLNSLSLSTDIYHIESGMSNMYVECAKGFLPSASMPALSQCSSMEKYLSHGSSLKSDLSHTIPSQTINSNQFDSSSLHSSLDCANQGYSSPCYTKDTYCSDELLRGKGQSKSCITYRSTPNLTEMPNGVIDEKTDIDTQLYRNKSTDCLLRSSDQTRQNLIRSCLFQNSYAQIAEANVLQVPKVPIRRKKLKRLEDIYNFSNSENTFNVAIRKSSRGLGLSISGGRDEARKDIFSQLIRIRKLYPLQPAMECGKLAVGDIILEVNGMNMIGLTNTEALQILRAATSDVTLKVFRPSNSTMPPFSTYLTDNNNSPSFPVDSPPSSTNSSVIRHEAKIDHVSDCGEFEITIKKREGSLGFTVSRREGTHDDGPPAGIYIKALIREPAISDGRIQPGDQILQVNGTNMSSMTHTEAITFLRNSPEMVILTLFRSDPPWSPYSLEDDTPVTKPLRWEAVELLNDRIKHKDSDSSNEKKRIQRKINKCNNGPSGSLTESESSTSSSSGKEFCLNENILENHTSEEDLSCEGPGLQRSQRPKSLDILNASNRKQRLSDMKNEDGFHRQASAIGAPSDLKAKSSKNDSCDGSTTKKGSKALLKWRGSTLPSSEDSTTSNTETEASFESPLNVDLQKHLSRKDIFDSKEEPEVSDQFPTEELLLDESRIITRPLEPWVRTIDVDLDRGWHGRLGFSLYNPPPDVECSPRTLLPCASEVKAVYPGSLAAKDGRIKVGDRLVEVNGESVLGKSSAEVIDMLRKTRGIIKMVFCRLEETT